LRSNDVILVHVKIVVGTDEIQRVGVADRYLDLVLVKAKPRLKQSHRGG
jgi:aminoglycoside phosphotransferase